MENAEKRRALEMEIASLYYIDRLSQKDIAARFDISRASVSRILNDAIEHEIVTINVCSPLTVHPEIAARIRRKYDLNQAYIAISSHEPEITKKNVGSLASNVIQQWFSSGAYLGISSGRICYYVSKTLQNPQNLHMETVQIIGNGYDTITATEGSRLVNAFCSKLLGGGHILNAPIMVSNRQTRDALIREQSIQRTMQLYPRIQIALFEISPVVSRLSYQLSEPWLSRADVLQLNETHAVGNIATLYFDLQGNCCNVGINDRRIGILPEEIVRIPYRIGMACGSSMLPATQAILASGMINTLIVDETLARELC